MKRADSNRVDNLEVKIGSFGPVAPGKRRYRSADPFVSATAAADSNA
jgi:hypothetical protein